MTTYESRWIRMLGLLSFILLGIYFLQPLLPASDFHRDEPLADARDLSLLEQGGMLPEPMQETIAEFHGKKSVPAVIDEIENTIAVLGDEAPPHDKHIEVDLTNQRIYAYEDEKKVFDFIVSTGKWGRTPTGEFTIWAKVKSQLMKGGDRMLGTYYYLPNVPYVIFFSNNEIAKSRGFSFHGTYWHDNFGYPMSHGCVNMKISDAQHLYYWANPEIRNPKAWSTNASNDNPGTKVVIYGEPLKG